MKRIAIIFLVFWASFSKAQQLPTFSQYMLNPYIVNPAAAGISDETSLFLHYRNQWMGFTNTPRTFAVTFDAPLMDNKYGVGLQFQSDQSHILSNIAGRLSYRYTFNIHGDHRIGFGLYGGFVQRSIHYSNLQNGELDDPVLFDSDVSGSIFDAGFGIWYSWNSLQAGFSIDQILNNKFNFTDDVSGTTTSFQSLRHFTLNAAYEYKFKEEKWSVKPGIALRSFQGANINVEGTVIGKWKDMLWAGVGYRQNFGVVFLAGIKIMDQITFGYSYDYSLGDIKHYNSGSHEVLLAYQFGKSNNGGSDAETRKRLRRQALDIRELKVQNEELKTQLEEQREEIKKLKAIEQRDSLAMQRVIDNNKVESIPQSENNLTHQNQENNNANPSSDGEVNSHTKSSNNEDIAPLQARISELEKQVEELSSERGSKRDEELQNRVKQLEGEIAILKEGVTEKLTSSEDANSGDYYVVTGAYFKVEDAKTLQKILKRELGLDTKVVSRADRKYFFVVTKQVKNNKEAQEEMNMLKEKGISKFINGNLWIYKAD